MKCETYLLNALASYRFVVVFSVYKGRLMLSRHCRRDTWETQGGHIETGETPLCAAKRELFEESGAAKYHIVPLFDYRVGDDKTGENGMVFLAAIDKIGVMPESEMKEVSFFDTLPENITYPDITPVLFQKAWATGLADLLSCCSVIG